MLPNQKVCLFWQFSCPISQSNIENHYTKTQIAVVCRHNVLSHWNKSSYYSLRIPKIPNQCDTVCWKRVKIWIDCFIHWTSAIFIFARCAQLNDEIEYLAFSIDFCDGYRFTIVQPRIDVDELRMWNQSNTFWYCFQWNCINNKLRNLCFTAFTGSNMPLYAFICWD